MRSRPASRDDLRAVVDLFCAYDVAFRGGVDTDETDFTDDLRAMDIPVLVSHGDDDQIVPLPASAPHTMTFLPQGELKVYPGAPHGLVGRFEQDFNDDLLIFLKS